MFLTNPIRSAVHALVIGAACLSTANLFAMSIERLEDLVSRADADLRGNILPYWQSHAIDKHHGGFVGELDAAGIENPAAPRGALLTSRILWTFSAAHRRWPQAGYLDMAQHAWHDLIQRFWDRDNGGLYWSIQPDGTPLETQKQIYGQAFGIYALAEYYKSTGEPEALGRAIQIFRLLQQHVHDRDNGGYFELFTADWQRVESSAAAVMEVGQGTKSQNTHLHIMEAFTNLLRVWPDPSLREAQRELVDIMLHKVLDRDTGHLGLFFDSSWHVTSNGVSYGHDIEAAWLMVEAAEVLGDPVLIASARDAAVLIARATLAEGVDVDGGVFDAGEGTMVTSKLKEWWPQAEGVVGFLCAWQISGDDRYFEAARKVWDFIESHCIDREQGGWHRTVAPDGTVIPSAKISFWKCPYHNGRACMEIIDRLTSARHVAGLRINDLEYLEMPGLNVMLAHDFYPEGHQGGVGIIQHGRRVATNGDLRLEPTPGQWQPVPTAKERRVDLTAQSISVRMSYPDPAKNRRGFNPIEYPDLEFSYDVRVLADGPGGAFRIVVDLDQPLPEAWIGQVGFNLELFPGILFGKTFLADSGAGIFPRQANGPGGYNARGEYQLEPLATGRRIVIAPESDEQRIAFELVRGGELQLLDGRAVHDNGWFVLRSTVPAGASTGAIEWRVAPHVLPGWLSTPVIQHSQVGYHPAQEKIAVVEIDRNDRARHPVRLVRIAADGRHEIAKTSAPAEWGRFLRYQYLHFDFTDVREPGMYLLEYGRQRSEPFRIGADIFRRGVWQPTLEYFLPVQMCHMRVNDGYRVWHGACHLGDAHMAPVDHNHFDGYLQGPSTLTDFKPGEKVPDLDRGGWHDAGDYDLRVESQSETIRGLALAYEEFGLDYDNTTIDQARRVVEIHRPDGKADVLQQIEHGALSIVGGYKSLGRLYRGIIVPTLRQYVMLGDAAAHDDALRYESTPDGENSSVELGNEHASHRWVFTEENPARECLAGAGLAAASRTLRGFNDSLADDCLRIARELWNRSAEDDVPTRLDLAVELLLATGEAEYADAIVAMQDVVLGSIERTGWLVARVIDRIDDNGFCAAFAAAIGKLGSQVAELGRETPYGVPYKPHIWGAGWGIQDFGMKQYFLHRAFPEVFPAKYMLNALNFVLGCHPGPNNVSFVSGVGAKSLLVAYGVNRGEWSHIPGGIGSGTALIRPDFPELLEWPFLWQQTEYVLGGGTTDYLFLVLAADRVLNGP